MCAALVSLLPTLAACDSRPGQSAEQTTAPAAAVATPGPAATNPAAPGRPGFLYGRVTDVDGIAYEGRLRWGQDQEAFWDDYFNGIKDDNPWAEHLALAGRPAERRLEIFGIKFGGGSTGIDRQFMARFGDIARVEAQLAKVQVTLKSGTTVVLDRFAAGDIDDGVRVWDVRRGVVDLDTRRIRTIEFLPTATSSAAADRLHGTVRTRQGDFTGFIQWSRQDCLTDDELDGRTGDEDVRLRYDTIRAIARQSRDAALVTLRDGREVVLSGGRDVSDRNLGVYVDDPRYGRVLVSWDAFERLDFTPAGSSGPGYADFAAGRPLAGSVTTRDGRRLAGRLVYDFDESETTETLDAAIQGVDYTIPFFAIASIVTDTRDARDARRALVRLRSGEELALERVGDLGERNAGLLVFVDGSESPGYVPWSDVRQIDFEDPSPGGAR